MARTTTHPHRSRSIQCAEIRLLDAWDDMYWLAKTNRVCAGLSDAEKIAGRELLYAV